MNKIKRFVKKCANPTNAAVILSSFFANSALADLPKMEPPSRGEGDGILATIKNYGYDIAILGGLIICAWLFFSVAGAAIETFREVRAGKKTWGDFGMICAVGVALIIIVIWLITKATDIL